MDKKTLSEADICDQFITPAIKDAGWDPMTQIRREVTLTPGPIIVRGNMSARNKKKKKFADYVLSKEPGVPIAVVEAKDNNHTVSQGMQQALGYAEILNVPSAFSSNGDAFASHNNKPVDGEDVEVEFPLESFPAPDELWKRYKLDRSITDDEEGLVVQPYHTDATEKEPRYYQVEAINRTVEAIAEGKKRILLTLATGTGKTAIAFQIAWKLFHTKWNLRRDRERIPRILFLADRNILADQAFNAFNSFEDDALVRIRPSEIKKKGRIPKNGSVFFTIFQTFMSGPEDTPYFGEYPRDFFDFIVIDECHRGGASDESTWRAIMEYFSPAVQLGLTATPKRDVNRDTYLYFGTPVYTYSLKQGINDGFLTPFKLKEISTSRDSYSYSPDDTVLEGEIEEGREYTREEQNKIIEIMDVERYRVQLLLEEINQNQKTLVFCASQIHAAATRDLINQYAESDSPNYCHRVTADEGLLGEQHLRDFQDNEKTIPTVLTTSHKLSTGVDAPEVRNIVLFRSVKSMVEFKQIVGRGTRLYDGKDYFTIFDFVNAHDHFNDPEWDGEPIDPLPCRHCNQYPCICPPDICKVCGKHPCECVSEPIICPDCQNDPCVCEKEPKRIIRVKLSDNHVRELSSTVETRFYNPDGKPISAEEFIKRLFGDLPSFFRDENELRKIWSMPDTRKRLLNELSDKGYTSIQLEDLRKLVHGEDSDLFDVLNYIAYHKDLVPRLERAATAKIHLDSYNPKQQEFLDFVLDQYVREGVSELDDAKLPNILELKYKALADAKAELGDIKSIRETFIGFQKYLYGDAAA